MDIASKFDLSKLPPKSQVGSLSAEIAGEGEAIQYGEGSPEQWAPPVARLAMPDMSQIKILAKYFGRSGYKPYPTWIYHPVEKPVKVDNHEQARKYGVVYRKTTEKEKREWNVDEKWDYLDGTEWSTQPYKRDIGCDLKEPGIGKRVIWPEPDPMQAQTAMIAALAKAMEGKNNAPNIEQIVAAVVTAMRMTDGTTPAAASEDVSDEKAMWLSEAERLGVKIDKRWGVEKIKAEVEKAA